METAPNSTRMVCNQCGTKLDVVLTNVPDLSGLQNIAIQRDGLGDESFIVLSRCGTGAATGSRPRELVSAALRSPSGTRREFASRCFSSSSNMMLDCPCA